MGLPLPCASHQRFFGAEPEVYHLAQPPQDSMWECAQDYY
jgi:hypothetical protein